jgi:PAS domain-containing protein
MHSVVDFFAWISILTAALSHQLAAVAGHAPSLYDLVLAVIVVSSVAFAAFAGFLAVMERTRFLGLRRWIRGTFARVQASTLLRDAIIAGCEESIAVLATHMSEPLSFSGGGALLQVCLDGPDAPTLAAALDDLLKKGFSFSLTARTPGGQRIALRGAPVGGHAVVYLRRESAVMQKKKSEYREVLDALPIPVWIRDEKLSLRWANNAFLAATGAASLDSAKAGNSHIDECELEFERIAQAGQQIVDVRRPVNLSGQPRNLAFTLRAMPSGGVAGMAIDVTNTAPAGTLSKPQRELFRQFLNRLTNAVAVFGPEGRLTDFNIAYARLWGLSENWLDTQPTQSEILDRLRNARKLPERRDYQAWKREQLELMEKPECRKEEVWHLPGGKSLRVNVRPHPGGSGVIFLYDDVTDKLRLESAYNSLAKVQAAILNSLHESMAIFGTDGRLKMHNANFAKLWQLSDTDLADEPHVMRLADICRDRVESGNIWEIVLASINASTPEDYNDWASAKRPDGSEISLSLARLPDGATIASFSETEARLGGEKDQAAPAAA